MSSRVPSSLLLKDSCDGTVEELDPDGVGVVDFDDFARWATVSTVVQSQTNWFQGDVLRDCSWRQRNTGLGEQLAAHLKVELPPLRSKYSGLTVAPQLPKCPRHAKAAAVAAPPPAVTVAPALRDIPGDRVVAGTVGGGAGAGVGSGASSAIEDRMKAMAERRRAKARGLQP